MILKIGSQSFLAGPWQMGMQEAMDLSPRPFASRRAREVGKGNANTPLANPDLVCATAQTLAPLCDFGLRELYSTSVRVVKDCESSIRWVNLFEMACV